jgi:hypothetical protein
MSTFCKRATTKEINYGALSTNATKKHAKLKDPNPLILMGTADQHDGLAILTCLQNLMGSTTTFDLSIAENQLHALQMKQGKPASLFLFLIDAYKISYQPLPMIIQVPS